MNQIMGTRRDQRQLAQQQEVETNTYKIKKLMNDLIQDYETNNATEEFCSKTRLLYSDRLNQNFETFEIAGVAYQVGLIADNREPLFKKEVCELLVKHYESRVRLIKSINETINYCCNRIFALTGVSNQDIFSDLQIKSGFSFGRCLHNPEVFTEEECGDSWESFIVLPHPELEGNQAWYDKLDSLQSNYLSTLDKLLGFIETLKQSDNITDNALDDTALKQMHIECDNIMTQLRATSNEIYAQILTSGVAEPIIDPNGNLVNANSDKSGGSMANAHMAAYRALHGLPAVGSE